MSGKCLVPQLFFLRLDRRIDTMDLIQALCKANPNPEVKPFIIEISELDEEIEYFVDGESITRDRPLESGTQPPEAGASGQSAPREAETGLDSRVGGNDKAEDPSTPTNAGHNASSGRTGTEE